MEPGYLGYYLIAINIKGFLLYAINTWLYTNTVWVFFGEYKAATIYLLVINLVTFIVYGIDKYNAIRQRSRVRIVTLLGLTLVGGSIGGLLAMYTFKHKTRKGYFSVGIPLIIVMQVVLVFFLMNAK